MDEALIRLQEEELQRTGRYYKHICFLCVPLLCVSCYLYGLRPLLLCGFAVLMGNLCDRLISLLRRRVYQAGDYSNESFALVITLLMPATVDWYVLAAAILAGALIGKEVFGGYGSYPFHPAAVGYAVAAVSWPEQVFRYPAPYANIPLWDASGVATSSTISDTLRSGGLINISALSLVLGEYAAPMGTGAAIVLVACGLFLWMQKDVRLSASLSFLITAGLIVFFFPRQLGLTEGTAFTAGLAFRLRCVRDEMLTGAMLFSAVFLLNEPYTCAHHRRGRILCPALLVLIVVLFTGCILRPAAPGYGTPAEAYAALPAAQGVLDGYQTMDALAALNFGAVIALNIQAVGITEEAAVRRGTIRAGLIAGGMLLVVYAMLTHIGGISGAAFPGSDTGASVLTALADGLFGRVGQVLLAVIFVIACFNTCVGLIASVGEYFHELLPQLSYPTIAAFFALMSMLLANIGLADILSLSVPVLNAIYPIAIILIVVEFLPGRFQRTSVWRLSILFTAIQSIPAALPFGPLSTLMNALPLSSLGFGWLLPALIGIGAGLLM